jgi:MFS family permease
MSAGAVTLRDYRRLVRDNRNFRLLWSAQIVSELGDWFYSVAIFSFLLQTAGTAKSVAFAFVLQVLPQCFAAPLAGVINDRASRKRVMIFADWTRAAIVLSMLLVRSIDTVWLLYSLLFLETVMWAMFEPARSAVVPNIVDPKDVIVANALSSTTWSINFAIGGALGGILTAMIGRDHVFVINSLSFVLSAALISRMRFCEPHADHLPPMCARDLADFTPVSEGIRYVLRDVRLGVTMFVKAGLSIMGTNWVLIPIMGERLFPVYFGNFSSSQAATMGMSVMLGSRGVGAIIGGLGVSVVAGNSKGRLRRSILVGFLCGSLGYLVLSRAPNIWIACLGLIVAHAGGSALWVASTTMLQEQTDDRFRGRVFSAEFALSMATLAAVSYASGIVVDKGVDVRTVAIATAAGMLVPALAWAFALRLWKNASANAE